MIEVLVEIGLLSSWGAWVILSVFSGDNLFETVGGQTKPILYYLLHGTGIISLFAAGLIAAIRGGYKKLTFPLRVAVWTLFVSAVTWSIIGYDLNDLLSTKVFGATGPVVWMMCVIIFAGMEENIWKNLKSIIFFIALATTSLAVIDMALNSFMVRERWFSPIVRYMILLMWFGGWTFLSISKASGKRIVLNIMPFVVFVLSCFVTRTRSWLIMSLFLFITFLFITKRNNIGRKTHFSTQTVIVYILMMTILGAGLFFRESSYKIINDFKERIFVDSRSEQYETFFSQISIGELIVGKGPKASYAFGDRKNYQYFDNAYIWMCFIGGLPVLLSYFFLIIMPGLKAYKMGAIGDDAIAAGIVILWGISCTGLSTYTLPSITPYCFLIYLLTGRCHSFVIKRNKKQKAKNFDNPIH